MSSKSIYRLPQSVFTPFFRRFTDERARDLSETIALHREVRARWLASGWSAEGVVDTVVFGIVDDITQYVDPPKSPAIAKVLDRFLRDCLALETTLFTCPDPPGGPSAEQTGSARIFAGVGQPFAADRGRRIA